MPTIALADEILTFRENDWRRVHPTDTLILETWRTAEEAIAALENLPVYILMVRHDLPDVERICSLLAFLESAAAWEGRSDIGSIGVVATTEAEAQPLINRLRTTTPYNVYWQPLFSDLFQPGEGVKFTEQPNPSPGWNRMLGESFGNAIGQPN